LRAILGFRVYIPSGVSLGSIDLRKAKLRSLDMVLFTRANLAGATFKGTLNDIFFQGSNLERANLSGITAKNVNFADSNLRDANLSGANLVEANLLRTDLRGADLTNVQLGNMAWAQWDRGGGNFVGCVYSSKTRWPEPMPKLTGAKLSDD